MLILAQGSVALRHGTYHLPNIFAIDLFGKNIKSLRVSPENKALGYLKLEGSKLEKMRGIGSLPNMTTFEVKGATHLKELGFARGGALDRIKISDMEKLVRLTGVEHLESLRLLSVRNMRHLQSIEGLKGLPQLIVLRLDNLPSLKTLFFNPKAQVFSIDGDLRLSGLSPTIKIRGVTEEQRAKIRQDLKQSMTRGGEAAQHGK